MRLQPISKPKRLQRQPRVERGVTLVEVLVASVVMAVLAGGTLLAFVSAIRISQRGPVNAEAADYAQQTLERYRNLIACDSAWFQNPCIPAAVLPTNVFDPQFPLTGLPAKALYGTGTRKFTVTPDDCDGNGFPGGFSDCYKVAVTVSWTPPS